jgi:hypothetical protein
MKTSQSFRNYFTIKSDKEKECKAPLYVVVTINKKKCCIALKKKMVDTSICDFGKRAAKGTETETKRLNTYLDESRLKISDFY